MPGAKRLFSNSYQSLWLSWCGGSAVKNPPANAGDVGLSSGLGISPGEGNGNSLQYPCLGNSMGKFISDRAGSKLFKARVLDLQNLMPDALRWS